MQMPGRPLGQGQHRERDEAASPVRAIMSGGNNRLLIWLLSILAALAIIGVLAKFVSRQMLSMSVKPKQYQALFLTNGQVYFGHISSIDDSYVKIKDIFYLQVQQQVQPQNKDQQQQPQVSLAKLGSELHGPEDVMYVSRQQVLFWENLKDDGKVVTAIKDFQSKK